VVARTTNSGEDARGALAEASARVLCCYWREDGVEEWASEAGRAGAWVKASAGCGGHGVPLGACYDRSKRGRACGAGEASAWVSRLGRLHGLGLKRGGGPIWKENPFSFYFSTKQHKTPFLNKIKIFLVFGAKNKSCSEFYYLQNCFRIHFEIPTRFGNRDLKSI
jgi:hypothetical protein